MTEETQDTKPAVDGGKDDHIKALNDENMQRRLENKELKERLKEFDSIKAELTKLKEASMTAEEQAKNQLETYQQQIQEAQAKADALTKQNALNAYMIEHEVDPAHHELLLGAINALPLDDAEAMAEKLALYKRQATAVPKVKAPPTGESNGLSMDDFTQLSNAQQQEYMRKHGGKLPFGPDLNKSSW